MTTPIKASINFRSNKMATLAEPLPVILLRGTPVLLKQSFKEVRTSVYLDYCPPATTIYFDDVNQLSLGAFEIEPYPDEPYKTMPIYSFELALFVARGIVPERDIVKLIGQVMSPYKGIVGYKYDFTNKVLKYLCQLDNNIDFDKDELFAQLCKLVNLELISQGSETNRNNYWVQAQTRDVLDKEGITYLRLHYLEGLTRRVSHDI